MARKACSGVMINVLTGSSARALAGQPTQFVRRLAGKNTRVGNKDVTVVSLAAIQAWPKVLLRQLARLPQRRARRVKGLSVGAES